ncbi:hypothetical protein GCM10011506_37840 [Marivirga lumbricoides]|uniref:Solute-binding protein family 3/N-terminal domain-containing protein n=1 Tax=Marivirga lumbricoides TaxID=1046115 RepID=A0ABQ1MXA6_9BACT|nr:hypothetical protein GCM10011506_37840 [Marivirga lumbricoides]
MKKALLFLLLITIGYSAFATQDSLQIQSPIKIGIKVTPPFVTKQNGGYDGLSIRSWEMINEKLDLDYEYVTFETLEELLSAVESGSVDMSINPITVTTQRMERMDFSQPYFISETVAAKKNDSNFLYFINNILSWNFFKALFLLVAVIFLFGFLVWIFERKNNKEEFGGKWKGLAQGFWWSAVTMTTVGYGDKSPRTLGGRIVGFVWMFAAIIMISSLTAGIASSLTYQSLQGTIRNLNDLEKMKVVTIKGSSADELLSQYNIRSKKVDFLSDAIQQISEDKSGVIVYDRPILKYAIEESDNKEDILISDISFKKDYYSYSFPKNSPLYYTINTNLIAILKTTQWNSLVGDY